MDREKVLARRQASRRHRQEMETRNWPPPLCREAWNHKVPGFTGWALLPRGTAKPAKTRWEEPEYWEVDPSKPYTYHNGELLAQCPDVRVPVANELAAIPSGMREKKLNNHYRAMSWNEAVQHGMIAERK